MATYDGPIVITGMGAVSPWGLGVEPLWEAVTQAARQPISLSLDQELGESEQQTAWGQSVGELSLADLLGRRGLQYMHPGTQYLLAASTLATRQAVLTGDAVDASALGIVIGSSLAGLRTMINYDYTAITEGPHYVSPMDAPNMLDNAPASHLAIRLKAQALNTTIASGQCAGLDALGYAAKMLRDGRARQVVTGGVEGMSESRLSVYQHAHVLADGPSDLVGRPFASTSSGWLLSEGAAAVVLESLASAQARDARPLAELAGWSSGFAPQATLEKRASVLHRTAHRALERAGVSPSEVDVVLAGAGGLPAQDQAEASALRTLLGNDTHAAITAIKGAIGETGGANGAFQALMSLCMLEHGTIPPTATASGQPLAELPGSGLCTDARPWPNSAHGTLLLLAQDLFGSTSAVVLRACGKEML